MIYALSSSRILVKFDNVYIGSDDGLSNRQQAIIWATFDPYIFPELYGITKPQWVN